MGTLLLILRTAISPYHYFPTCRTFSQRIAVLPRRKPKYRRVAASLADVSLYKQPAFITGRPQHSKWHQRNEDWKTTTSLQFDVDGDNNANDDDDDDDDDDDTE